MSPLGEGADLGFDVMLEEALGQLSRGDYYEEK